MASHPKTKYPVIQFTIKHGSIEYTTSVGEMKYKSALFLLYLAMINESSRSYKQSLSFILTPEMRQMTRNYFGNELVRDAENNPDTKHRTIQMLLVDETVAITLYFDGNFSTERLRERIKKNQTPQLMIEGS